MKPLYNNFVARTQLWTRRDNSTRGVEVWFYVRVTLKVRFYIDDIQYCRIIYYRSILKYYILYYSIKLWIRGCEFIITTNPWSLFYHLMFDFHMIDSSIRNKTINKQDGAVLDYSSVPAEMFFLLLISSGVAYTTEGFVFDEKHEKYQDKFR